MALGKEFYEQNPKEIFCCNILSYMLNCIFSERNAIVKNLVFAIDRFHNGFLYCVDMQPELVKLVFSVDVDRNLTAIKDLKKRYLTDDYLTKTEKELARESIRYEIILRLLF